MWSYFILVRMRIRKLIKNYPLSKGPNMLLSSLRKNRKIKRCLIKKKKSIIIVLLPKKTLLFRRSYWNLSNTNGYGCWWRGSNWWIWVFCLFIKIGALMYTQMHIYPQSWIMISSSTMLFCIMCLPTCMLVFIVILFISFILFTPKVKMIK